MESDAFLKDLESRYDAQLRREQDAEAFEVSQGEALGVSLGERFSESIGNTVSLQLRDGSVVEGEVLEAYPLWMRVKKLAGQSLIPRSAVVSARGLAPVPGVVERVESGITFASALREVAAEGSRVTLRYSGIEVAGYLVRVGLDFVDVADVSDDPLAIATASIDEVVIF